VDVIDVATGNTRQISTHCMGGGCRIQPDGESALVTRAEHFLHDAGTGEPVVAPASRNRPTALVYSLNGGLPLSAAESFLVVPQHSDWHATKRAEDRGVLVLTEKRGAAAQIKA
jgi:hypothetical protein